MDTPDAWPLNDGSGDWAFVYLAQGPDTVWEIGKLANVTHGTEHAGQFVCGRGEVPCKSVGRVDSGPAYRCQQSLTTPDGRRASIGWLGVGPTGANWTGAQSLPRVITRDASGLVYSPLPELAKLGGNPLMGRRVALGAGSNYSLAGLDGTYYISIPAVHEILTLSPLLILK